ncbi:GGDEF domain-containing protein [Aquincola sp. MAHUQ-54]|uniref:diguanylate cyclase n=1 Tax=Aquincola agrisoli TaxID=3119538 RepID=A0AAW9Q599_9BURK
MSIESYAATFSDTVLAVALLWLFSYAARIAVGVRGIRLWGWSHLAYTLGSAIQTTALWPLPVQHAGALLAVAGLGGLAVAMRLFVHQQPLSATERRLLALPLMAAAACVAYGSVAGGTELDSVALAGVEMCVIASFAYHLQALRSAPYHAPAQLMRAGCALLLLLYLADLGTLLVRGSAARLAGDATWIAADLSLWFLLNFSMVMLASFRALEAMRHMAHIDPLTGALNRRGFEAAVATPAEGAPAAAPTGVLVIDVDHFKQVNDRFGHEAGDRVLRSIASTLLSEIRPVDLLARFGGEEFVIVLADCDGEAAFARAEHLRERAKALQFEWLDAHVRITLSVGVASGPASDIERLRQQADEAMYEAKRGGRDRALRHGAAAQARAAA